MPRVHRVSNHNWRCWRWPWHTFTREVYGGFAYYSHFGGFGPFQWHWYSNNEGWF